MKYNYKPDEKLRRRIKRATSWIPFRPLRYRIRQRLSECLVSPDDNAISILAQDLLLFEPLLQARRLIVFLVPEVNAITGGVYSIFSLASESRRFKRLHKSEVVIMTYPNEANKTYFRQTFFRNEENVYRFEQLLKFEGLESLTIHLPEYYSASFIGALGEVERQFLTRIPRLNINILNQNILLMPAPERLDGLKELAGQITQTIGHHKYATQELSDRYGIPALLIPAHTDLSKNEPLPFHEKENLIIYSPDEHPLKAKILERIKISMPGYKLVEIRGIPFEEYMNLASLARFSITFGEGFDGYFYQPIRLGGVAFTVYNGDFFPSESFLNYKNVFRSYDEMLEKLTSIISVLENQPEEYASINRGVNGLFDELYNDGHYLDCIKRFYQGDFDFYPPRDDRGNTFDAGNNLSVPK